MAIFYDTSDWQEKEWCNTGGTRNKAIFENPEDSSLYFFKTSLKKTNRDYKYEFWSEIIASEIGINFGFNVLKYNIAHNDLGIGCISQLMINENESLIEGYRYLSGFDSSYSPKNKKAYTFQFIIKALEGNGLGHHIDELIKIIIFDSIIGNGDRHQENWGFIEKDKATMNNSTSNTTSDINKRNFFKLFTKRKQKTKTEPEYRFFAPIYDSGSCLGREIADEKVAQMLSDEKIIKTYIDRGVSEIHWEGNKINHFALIEKIKERYDTLVVREITRIKGRFDANKIEYIVMSIDRELPMSLSHEKIPDERKRLIIKLITMRCERLMSLLK